VEADEGEVVVAEEGADEGVPEATIDWKDNE